MKFNLASTACAFTLSSVALMANAALIDRGGGLIYDTDLNVTWLSDANYSRTSGYSVDGILSYTDAVNWVGNLNVGGYDDWRLPSAVNQFSSALCTGFNCEESELGHLFYVTLGGTAGNPIPQSPFFTNIQTDVYWSLTEEPFTYWNYLWFDVRNGYQAGPSLYQPAFYAWAVRDGDITSVSVPAAVWLFGSGLLGLIGAARRKAV